MRQQILRIIILRTSILRTSILRTSILRTISIFLCCSVPSGWAVSSWQPWPEVIRKSASDPRHYQAITLANGMKVLLVSDTEAVKAMTALTLPVGSLEDPPNQQGMAHYLEHMVLMGSERFPKASSLAEFLKKQGGSYNASTAAYRTTFYLEADNDALAEASDRLANAIAQPLLDPLHASRERNAVDAEMTLARARDGMRMGQVTAETLNPAHPGSRFSGGNLATLSDKQGSTLQDELITFHQRYYSSNLMMGVMYGKQPLSQLALFAARSFGQIPNRHASVPPITVPVVTSEQKGIIIHYVPAQPGKKLQIEFRIDNNSGHFRSKTDTYVSYLINNRSKNTLSDWLQKQGLADAIHASADPMRARNTGVFTISVSLTERGLAQRDRVVAALFSYLNLLADQGIKAEYFNEIAQVLNVDFRYPSITRNMYYIAEVADRMLRVPLAHTLDAPYVADRYDAQAIAARLAEMKPENARIWFISPSEPHNKRAYFVDAPYKVEKIAAQRFAEWQQAGQQIALSLPTLNPYIPDNFALIASEHTATADNRLRPQLILNKPGLRLFYMPSQYFASQPKAHIAINLPHKDALASARQQVLFALNDYLAGIALDQLAYQASVGGIHFSTAANHGLSLYASGFTQHLPRLLTALVAGYSGFQPTPAQLTQAKSWYREQLAAAEAGKAYDLAIEPAQQLSQVPYTERHERRKMPDTITVQDVSDYRDDLLKKSAIEILITGNMSAPEAITLAESLQQQLGGAKADLLSAKEGSARKEVIREEVVVQRRQLATLQRTVPSTDNALAAVYIPVGYNEMEGMACSALLAHIIDPWFYHQLRTQEQLGYALFSFPISVGNQWGIGFLLQSNNKTADYLWQRYQAFYPEAEKRLRAMPPADFAQYKQGLIRKLLQRPQTLDEEAGRFNKDFNRHNHAFDSREKMLAQVQQLTVQQLADYFHRSVITPQGLALLSQVSGSEATANTPASPAGWKAYPDTSTLQKTLPLTTVMK